MNNNILNGFIKELEKMAIDLEGATKAVDATVKPNLIRKGIKIDPTLSSGKLLNFNQGANLGPMAIRSTPANLPGKELSPVTQHPGKIFAQGDSHNFVKQSFKDNPAIKKSNQLTRLNPQNKEMFNKAVLMHEGIERQQSLANKKNPFTMPYKGHDNPMVILKENNIVSSMPKEFNPVKNNFKKMRRADTTAQDLKEHLGINYGEQRYSRHAIKRMGETLERKGVSSKPVDIEHYKQQIDKYKAAMEQGKKDVAQTIPTTKPLVRPTSTPSRVLSNAEQKSLALSNPSRFATATQKATSSTMGRMGKFMKMLGKPILR